MRPSMVGFVWVCVCVCVCMLAYTCEHVMFCLSAWLVSWLVVFGYLCLLTCACLCAKHEWKV